MRKLRSLYLENRFFGGLIAISLLFFLSYLWSFLFIVSVILFVAFMCLVVLDVFMLILPRERIEAHRQMNHQFSLDDENPVEITITNHAQFPYAMELVDEVPYEFQMRHFSKKLSIRSGESVTFGYSLRPVTRGEYVFGNINIFLNTRLKLVSYRKVIEAGTRIAVYPSIMQMKKHELIISSQTATLQGIKRLRKLGANNEFEQIKNYVQGDDYRNINWKATSRRNELMVNQYQEERSQNVYCIIDKSRSMRMPFNGMSLLDYAINSALVMSNTAMHKGDKAGLITFSDKLGARLSAESGGAQLRRILEVLYKQKTRFDESNFELLYYGIRQYVKGRSLILLYTNFESLYALERVMPILRRINKMHLLVVVFFENTELAQTHDMKCETVKDIYFKTLAEKFLMEKELIVRELGKYGIQCVLSKPEELSVSSINKYLELKSRGMI